MKNIDKEKSQSKNIRIKKIGYTTDNLTARSGLFLITKFIEQTNILPKLKDKFKEWKCSSKGISVESFFRQILLFFINGEKLNISYFDDLKKNQNYNELLNIPKSELASSHQIKRMFSKFNNKNFIDIYVKFFRNLMSDIFIKNLKSSEPEIVHLGIDTEVFDNNTAKKREGNNFTYKKVNGFQPLQVYWNGLVIDAIFREGKRHSNYSDHVIQSIKTIVEKIRLQYNENVPIIISMDSGFLDEKNLNYFDEELGIYFVCAGKKYNSIKDYVGKLQPYNFTEHSSRKWKFFEFANKLKSWNKFYRCFFVKRIVTDTDQMVLDFAASDRIIYTNIGRNSKLDKFLESLNNPNLFSSEYVINKHHQRAKDELINKDVKNFFTRETFPFKSFSSNQLYYYLMIIAFNLLRTFQKHVSYEIINSNCHPSTFRRYFIDIAGKIVCHARVKTLRIVENTYEKLKINKLFDKIKTLDLIIAFP